MAKTRSEGNRMTSRSTMLLRDSGIAIVLAACAWLAIRAAEGPPVRMEPALFGVPDVEPGEGREEVTFRLYGSTVAWGMVLGEPVDRLGGGVEVLRVLPDMPASQAGVLAGDVVLSIDGFDVREMSLDEVADWFESYPSTTLALAVSRDGALKRLHLVRGIKTVPAEKP
jgi:hypothetical protein